ncbi:YwmB family TATA-box binding protein [Bacillaceae bacterium Marseille-Q3522]|nr:YwmB family TATA-box binding protein [Bacillaceae bacterium Marseille-Q3522]
MKKIIQFIIVIGTLGYCLLFNGNKASVAEDQAALLKLASVMEKENLTLTNWSIHAREKLDKTISEQEIKQQFHHSTWNWSIKKQDQQIDAVAVRTTVQQIEEKIHIISFRSREETHILYEAGGSAWGKESIDFINSTVPKRISDIFHNKATFFSCIKGEVSDKMEKELPDYTKDLLAAFQAKEVEALKEESFLSTSAYSQEFSNSIVNNNREMNLQIGIRTHGLGGKTTVVVGTPIITIEY